MKKNTETAASVGTLHAWRSTLSDVSAQLATMPAQHGAPLRAAAAGISSSIEQITSSQPAQQLSGYDTVRDQLRLMLDMVGSRRRRSPELDSVATCLDGLLRDVTRTREEALDRAVQRQATTQPAATAPTCAPFAISLLTPRLHDLEHEGVTNSPGLRIDQGAERPDSMTHLRRLAQNCAREIGVLGGLRNAGDDQVFEPESSRFDHRMLKTLDTLIALGSPFHSPARRLGERERRIDVLGLVLDFASDAFVADPVRAFARAFVLGSVRGHDTAHEAACGLSEEDSHARAATVDALSLAPNPAIDEAVRQRLGGSEAHIVIACLDVLRRRRSVTLEDAAQHIGDPRGDVRCAAVRALGSLDEDDLVVSFLAAVLEGELDPHVRIAIAEQLMKRQRPLGLQTARELLDDGAVVAEAMRLVAIAGHADDVGCLAAAARRCPSAAWTLGWHGHIGHVELLMDLAELPGAGRAATQGLLRLLGPATRPTDWRRFWSSESPRYDAALRYRFGRRYDARATIAELQRGGLMRDRALAVLELTQRLGSIDLDPNDWVCRQYDVIGCCSDAVDVAESESGCWFDSASTAAA